MNGAFHVAAIGLEAQQRALDIIAGNIANLNTPAFKRSQVRFSEVMATRADPDVPRADLSAPTAPLAGVRVEAEAMVNETGALQATARPMDFAIEGQGFVELMAPNGQTLLWRGGGLTVGEDGLLAAANGLPLKAAITIPDDATAITIGADGTVRVTTGDAALPTEAGQIDLVRVDDPRALSRLDSGLYRVAEDARMTAAKPGEDGAGVLVQGSIERANVEMTSEMVQLLLVQRAYGANAQIVQAADQLMALANGLRRG